MTNFTPNQNEYNNMTPFKTWLKYQINTWGLNSFPFVESDFDDLTNYAMMMKLMKHFNVLIENQNMVEEDMTNLYNAFTELQTYLFEEFADYKSEINTSFNELHDYVYDYFDNLDVQEEINNKLDEMVEDGTLSTIIENTLGGYVNVKSLGAKGDGETDDTLTIQEIIDNNPNKTIYFPDGIYLISSHLETPANNNKSVNLELSNNAVIKASNNYDDEEPMICLGIKDYDDYHLYEDFASFGIAGGTIDCNNITGGISVQNCIRPYIKNMSIDNVNTIGVNLVSGANNNSLDATIENLTIICSNNNVAIGMKLTCHDNIINNVRTFSGKYGFYFGIAGGNHLTDTHCLAVSTDYNEYAQDMIAYFFLSGGGNYNYLTRPYSDGFATAFYFDGTHNNFIRDAYVFYWNEEDSTNHTALRFTSRMTAGVSNLHCRFPALGTNRILNVSNTSNPNGWIKELTIHDTSRLNDNNEQAFSPLFNIDTRNSLQFNRKIVLIGDSYLEGYTPDGNVTSWGTYLQNYLGLTSSNVIISYLGGSSFAGSKPFTNLVNALSVDYSVTDVIVGGGYNDRTFNRSQILTGMTSFKTACETKFPNAKIHCAMIGWTTASDQLGNLYNTANNYQICSSQLKIGFLNNTCYSLHAYFSMFSSDGIHPNDNGQQSIARSICNALLEGSANVIHSYKTIKFTPSGDCSGLNTGSSSMAVEINDNIAQITQQGLIDYAISSISYTANGKNDIEVGTITDGYLLGSNYKMFNCPVQLIVHDTTPGTYYKVGGILIIRSGKIYISFADINDAGSNYRTFTTLNQIQVMPFSCCFDSLFC